MNELNKWLQVDIEEIPEAEVSIVEKKRMKKRLLDGKRKSPLLLKWAMAACVFIGGSAVTAVAFPSLAQQIPVLQDIVSYFDDDQFVFNHFSEVAQPIGLTESSNGSDITIEEAVYDGTSATISFALKTEADLGDFPISDGMIQAAGANGYGASINMKRVDDHTYAGMITMSPDFRFWQPSTLKLSWEPLAFEDIPDGNRITGDWKFDFKVRAIDNHHIRIGQNIEFEGGSLLLTELSLNKLSTILRVETDQMNEKHYMTFMELKDNLGNSYPMHFGTGGSSLWGSYQQITFDALDPAAESLTITPVIKYSEHFMDDGVEVKAESVTVDLP